MFLGAWLDACALWRLYKPFLNLPGSSFYIFRDRPKFDLFSGADTIVVQRCCTQPQYQFLDIARKLEIKIVYDLDDDIWNIPEYNPAHGPLTHYRQGFAACIGMVDAVTVSTKTLAKVVKKHVPGMLNQRTGKEIPVFVCENRIDQRMFVTPKKNEEQTIVGWAGSSSHVGDLVLVEDAILAAAKEHPKVRFEYRGCMPQPNSQVPKLETFQQKPWSPVPEFGARMPLWGWSIALCPVTNHEFNNSKSCIKMLEAAYCKIPCLASWVTPYEEFCSKDKELRWLLCAGASAFTTKLRILLNEPDRCKELGQRMYDVMDKYYSFHGQPHEGWTKVFEFCSSL